MVCLLVVKGGNPGQRLPLEGEKIVLGRNPDCQVVIAGTAVSRAHAFILKIGDQYFIEDMKSRNGTFVNNLQITERTPLKDNDRIKICDFICTFQDPREVPGPIDPTLDASDVPAEDDHLSTIQASMNQLSNGLLLETQPAEKLKALLDITASLSKTLEVDGLLPKIVESLFNLFRQADRAFIILREATGKPLIPKVIKTRRPQDETTARFSRFIVNRCLENVQALLSDDASSDSRFAPSQSISNFRIRSVMCAPLWTQEGIAFGVIQLDTQDRVKKFTQDDLKLLVGVASQASIALENAKLHHELVAKERLKRDLELAREVQRGFLPSKPPKVAGYEFFAYYESAYEVGGDYYDFIPLGPTRLASMLGDVAGKGVAAALLMAKISSDARFCMLTEPDPGKAFTKLNDLIVESGLTERFVTLETIIIDSQNHNATWVNAGHLTPLLYHRSNLTVEQTLASENSGLPIGVSEGQVYLCSQIPLEPGDCIILFSDGITEAMDGNRVQLQVKGICEALEGESYAPRKLGERLIKAVKQHSAGQSQHDDMTLVCIGRNL